MARYLKDEQTGFLVGDDGSVIGVSGKTLKQRESNCGYLRVVAYINGKHTSFSVHRLVAANFLPITDSVVNHKDGNKKNNCVENLEWCSRSYNARHSIESGLSNPRKAGATTRATNALSGVSNGRSKLTDADVREIRARPKIRGEKPWLDYGISNVMYYLVVSGKNWSHVV